MSFVSVEDFEYLRTFSTELTNVNANNKQRLTRTLERLHVAQLDLDNYVKQVGSLEELPHHSSYNRPFFRPSEVYERASEAPTPPVFPPPRGTPAYGAYLDLLHASKGASSAASRATLAC